MNARWALVGLGLSLWASGAHADDAEDVTLSLLMPGGGYLIADAALRVPLELVVEGATGPEALKSATVRAQKGKVVAARVARRGVVAITYVPPAQAKAGPDTLELTLVFESGVPFLANLALNVTPPEPPRLELGFDPSALDVGSRPSALLRARAVGTGLVGLDSRVSDGTLSESGAVRGADPERELDLERELTLPAQLPFEAPSHILGVAAVSGRTGYSAKAAGLSIIAPVRFRAEIPKGSHLTITGSEDKPSPVPGAADGYTVINTRARYGSEIRAFAVSKKKKDEVPIEVPSGLVPLGVVATIPGQNVADGGTGPTLVVAMPPNAFGGPIDWPPVTIEGAKLVSTVNLAPDLRALVIERPTSVGEVTVLADGTAIGTVVMGGGHGRSVELTKARTKAGERAAVRLSVKDGAGNSTDLPRPSLRFGGQDIPVERESVGVYRAAIQAGAPGEPGTAIAVVARLSPPPLLAGDPLDASQTELSLELSGPAPAVRLEAGELKTANESLGSSELAFGVGALGSFGATLSSQLAYGGGVLVDLRPGLLNGRLRFRSGLELSSARRDGFVALSQGIEAPAVMRFGALSVPVEACYVLARGTSLELVAHAGGSLRFETASLEVDGERAGGSSRTALGARLGLGAGFDVGPGSIVLDGVFDGIGVSSEGLSGDRISFEGSLSTLRLDLGYVLWFGSDA